MNGGSGAMFGSRRRGALPGSPEQHGDTAILPSDDSQLTIYIKNSVKLILTGGDHENVLLQKAVNKLTWVSRLLF